MALKNSGFRSQESHGGDEDRGLGLNWTIELELEGCVSRVSVPGIVVEKFVPK